MKLVGIWLALEDVTLENGCLWFIPGSHQSGIDRRFIRNSDPQSSDLTTFTAPNPDYDDSKFIAGPVPKGKSNSIKFIDRIIWVDVLEKIPLWNCSSMHLFYEIVRVLQLFVDILKTVLDRQYNII